MENEFRGENKNSINHLEKAEVARDFWTVESDTQKVEESEERFKKLLQRFPQWDEDEILGLQTTMRELLINAIVHGNCCISREKGELDEAWEKRIKQAQAKAEAKNKRIFVEVEVSGTKVTVSIQDEGKDTPEFWQKKSEQKTLAQELEWYSGRGLEMANMSINSLNFEKNQTGVKVTFVRDLDLHKPEIS